MRQAVLLALMLTLGFAAGVYAQNTEQINAIQYYFNDDPGVGVVGNGAIVPVTPTANLDQIFAITVPNSLSNGLHNLYVRAKDLDGKWSLTERRLFYIQTIGTGTTEDVVAYQYYFDTDPGINDAGNGAIVPVTPTSNFNQTVAITVPGSLANGFHNLYIRTKDVGGQWSLTERRMFYIQTIGTGTTEDVVAYQYYFDTDPGVADAGNGAIVPVTTTSNFNQTVAITVPGSLANGFHNLYIRTKDEGGQWSFAERRLFYIQTIGTATIEDVVAYQYYFDTDPGVADAGNGAIVPVTPTSNFNQTVAITVPGSLANGFHNLYIRTKDVGGQWSLIERRMFYINFNNTIVTHVTALEYYYDNDPGVGNANPYAVTTSANIDILAELSVPCLSTGTHYLYVRARDENGSWSIIERDTLEVTGGLSSSVISPAGPITFCPLDVVTLTTDSVPGVSYQWQRNGTDIPGATTFYYDITEAGNYQVKAYCGAVFSISNVVVANVLPLLLFYADTDIDGYGDAAASVSGCTPPTGYVANSDDCDDTDATVNPAATEICNLIDDDCDGLIDDGVQITFYYDDDNDGFGDPAIFVLACTQPANYVHNSDDCDDTDSDVYPGATEICNGLDDDCNGLIDEGVQTIFYADNDNDNYGDPATTLLACTAPPNYVLNSDDCDDTNANVNPGVTETCNLIDDNCDGYTDEGLQIIFYADADNDGYGDLATTVLACALPSGYASNSDDCDDTNADVYPGATEICNLIDDNCDGFIDDNDPYITNQPTWYADIDEDGFGDPSSQLISCTQPTGYVDNSDDCDDTDADVYPGQVWYIDNDDDGYGTGATLTQCLRPAHGYLAVELTETTGDCDDNNALINSASQYLTFSGPFNFTTSLCTPLTGTSYTDFTFAVNYFDTTNALPPSTFPRVILDFEGNGVFNNTNDRVVIMEEHDASDQTTTDGKRYVGTINSLPVGTDWQTRVQITNGTCLTQFGPFNYPDVQILPDLQIFANDITFSNPNPPVSSQLTVNAVVHNVSDFPAQNFYVHLINQYDNTSPADILVNNLAPHSATTVSWQITTPAVPAWCPMQVSIDNTYVIDESNELDNIAVRPFTNGNYTVPGGIEVVDAASSPSVAFSSFGANTTISGQALYYGTPNPLTNSTVAGATVTFTVVETNATFTTYTNFQGYFSYTFPSPLAVGPYTVTGSVTDYTFTGEFSIQFEITTPPCLPDFRTNVIVSSNTIVAGSSISGSITVKNYGCSTYNDNTLLEVSQTGGTPTLGPFFNVPALAPNESYTVPFYSLTFNTPGTYILCGMADAGYAVTELYEGNNSDCEVIVVLPAEPDIYPNDGPCCSSYICAAPTSVGFTVGNSGGAATGAFNCNIIVRLNNVVIGPTINYTINNIDAQSQVSFSVPYTFAAAGYYSFELQCDVAPTNAFVAEANELNNSAIYGISILDCLPDLVFGTCELDVQPADPPSGNVTYSATLINSGNATAFGPINVRFLLSGGTTTYNTQYSGDLAPGQSTIVTVTAPSVAAGIQTLTAIADFTSSITELNEGNNTISNSLCWDFQPVELCGPDFWDKNYLVNQFVYLSVGLKQYNLYDASSVKVRFQVSGPGLIGTILLGDAVLNNVGQTCQCPLAAVCPVSFVFPQTGTFTFTMTADPDAVYPECDETNNVLVVTVDATVLPDMRILSQHINPSQLNPQTGETITLDVSYENIGQSNISDQMGLSVLVDNVQHGSVLTVNGLVTNDNATVTISPTWSSTVPGSHIVRAIIDNNEQVTESNETNNEATRAVIVGEAANLYFQVFESSNPSPAINSSININVQIGNDGDLACEADVEIYYTLNSNVDQIVGFNNEQLIGTVHVSVDGNSNTAFSFLWVVLDNSTTLIGKIINSTPLEFNYDDNEASTTIGSLALTLSSTQSCLGENNGTLTANATGGSIPYSYSWSNTYNAQVLTAGPGTYSVTVTDNSGQQVTASGIITEATTALSASSSATAILCNGGTSTVTVSASGGTPPYLGIGTFTEAAGTYSYTVTDDNGCTATTSVTISEPDALSASSSATAILCNGGNSTVTVSASGGTPPYSGIGTFSELAGTYPYTVTDANTCVASGSYVISQPPPISIISAISNASTFGGSDGVIDLTVLGGFPVYNFLWSNGATTEDVFGLSAGLYNVSVSDANGCTVNEIIEITEPAGLDVQSIDLPTGWSLMSTYIDPVNPSVDSVFAPVVASVSIIKNGSGAAYWPYFGLNAIGNIIMGQGYQARMTVTETLAIYGTAVSPENFSIPIPTSWSLLGYLRQVPGDIVAMLSPIVGNIAVVKDGSGEVYWPLFGVNAIGNMQSGKGYQIRLTAASVLIYPANSVISKSDLVPMQPGHYKSPSPTGNNMTLGIPETAFTSPPDFGDEIGVFAPSGQLVGSGIFTGSNMAITIWGDDELTPEIDGPQAGNEISFRTWNGQSEKILSVENWIEGNGLYEKDDIQMVGKLSLVSVDETAYRLEQNVPNPFNSGTSISFYLPENSEVSLMVFDILGNEIETLTSGKFPVGKHTVEVDGQKYATGTYFYRLIANDFVETKQMEVGR